MGVNIIMVRQVALKIFGEVQGVGMRFSIWRKAEQLGLRGWVRNEEDGSVKVVAEAEDAKLKAIIEWLEKESPAPRVDKIEQAWQEGTGEFDSFEITY